MEEILTAGAIGKIINQEVVTQNDLIPVLQVTQLKVVTTHKDPTNERFRLVLSDGSQIHQGILGTSQNGLVKDGILQTGSIVRLTQFTCKEVLSRRLVIVVDLEVIATKADIIGRPAGLDSNATGVETQVKSELSGGGLRMNNTATGRSDAAIAPQVGQSQGFGNGLNPTGFETQVRSEFPGGGLQTNNTETRRSDAAITQQVGQRQQVVSNESAPPTRVYNNPSSGYARDPPTSYPRQPAYQAQPPPPPMYGNRGPVARNEAPPRIIPINALSPYSGRWTIKARVTSKGELRHYNNQRGDGKVFSFDLLDADSGEIRVTCFNAVADQFFDMIVVGNLYLISRGSLRPAQKNFNHLRNDYEITLDNASTVQQCYDDDATIPRNQFHFRSIGDFESMENNSIIDVIGIVSSISPTGTIMRKNGTETQKRALQLKDMSGRSVEVTMWGNFCNTEGQKLQDMCDSGRFPVLAVKNGRISEFNGKAVSTIASSQLFIDPDFDEAQRLKVWFEREGKSAPCISISREFSGSGRVDVRKTLSQIKDEKLGTSEKPDWITVSATVIYIKTDNFCYTACPIMNGERPCSKKVTNNGDGTWRCDKCDKSVDECDYRYILQLQIQDHTDLTYVTAFQEAGEEIIGIPAKDLYFMKYEDQDEEKFEDIIRRVTWSKFIFKLKVKEETYSDEQRVKSTVVKVEKLNYSSDTRTILDAMDKLRTADASSLPVKVEGPVNTGAGSSGTRDASSVERREFGLSANQSGQYVNQYSTGTRPIGARCSVCGSNGHVSANCPSAMSETQGQYMGGSYRGTTWSNGGGPQRQRAGNF